MKTLSPEEFKKKYGEVGISQFSQTSKPKMGFLGRTKEAFSQGVSKMGESIQDSKGGRNPISTGSKFGAGLTETVFSPITAAVEPLTKPTIGKGVDYLSNKISNSPSVQKFADSRAGEVTSRVAEDVGNLNTIAGTAVTPFGASKGFGATVRATKVGVDTISEGASKVGAYTKNIAGDVLPSTDRIVNHQVTKALDLTAGDVKNISLSTGNEVGKFLAEKNLIGVNKIATVANLEKFFKQNYDAVRSEISRVQRVYKQNQVPRYVEALKAIRQKTLGTPGLQKVGVEVENLLNKKEIALADVQRVKELIDSHFNLYKATGDVGDSVAKQGLDNIRKDIRQFIEKQVKENTGADIGDMNNSVSTSRGVLDAIEARSTAGLTRSNLKLGDLGIFGLGMGMGGPLGGAALLFGKKLIESPSVQLRIAKYLDSLSDASKMKIQTELQKGQIPTEFNQFIKQRKSLPSNVK